MERPFLHKHAHYRRECEVCREHVNQMFLNHFHHHKSRKSSKERGCIAPCLRATIVIYSLAAVVFAAALISCLLALKPLRDHSLENYALVALSVVAVVFAVGLAAAVTRSWLWLRVFGSLLAYLFLLVLASTLYALVYLAIVDQSEPFHSRLVIVCLALTLANGLLAVCPFTLAHLILQERRDRQQRRRGVIAVMRRPTVRFSDHWL